MMGLRIIAVSLAQVLGIVWATRYGAPEPAFALLFLSLGGGALSAAVHLRERRWQAVPPLLVVGLALLAGFPLGMWCADRAQGVGDPRAVRSVVGALTHGANVTLRGWVSAEPELRGNGNGEWVVRVTGIEAGGMDRPVRPENVLLRIRPGRPPVAGEVERLLELTDPMVYGYTVRVRARHQAVPPALNPAQFDQDAFLAQSDMAAQFACNVGDVAIEARTPGAWITEIALAAKRSFLATYRQVLTEPASRLVAGATLGTRRAVERVEYRGMDITAMFRWSGVGHVLAVSGLHVSVVTLLLYALFSGLRMRPRHFAPFLIVILVLFAILTGARPSSLRAVIMNSFVLIGIAYLHMTARRATAMGLALSSFLILFVNPLVLFSPSFLLSFGAVLSLVLIAPVIDGGIRAWRGATFVFMVTWVVLVVVLARNAMPTLLDGWSWMALAGLLALAWMGGESLNLRFPCLWRIGSEWIPPWVRMMLSAQFAIQVGMMVPMSAWFFGQFPVAGLFVNLVAIPLIGVVVQLGMIIGLLGMIPHIGVWLALPFGVANSLACDFFYWTAWLGTQYFAFPAVPRPTPAWLTAYYTVLGGILLIPVARNRIFGWVYRRGGRARPTEFGRMGSTLAWTAALLLTAIPAVYTLARGEPACRAVTVYATRSLPVFSAVSDRGTAFLVNAGDGFTGSRLLFSGLRAAGATSVDLACVGGFQPAAGFDGLSALAAYMPIRHVRLPLVVGPGKDYLNALGDEHIVRKAREGQGWAQAYASAYTGLVATIMEGGGGVGQLQPGRVPVWSDLSVVVLAGPEQLPRRFVSAARSPILAVDTRGFRWLVVTESLPEILPSLVRELRGTVHVLVLPVVPRDFYEELVMAAVRSIEPRVVIVTGDREPPRVDPGLWRDIEREATCFFAWRDGAVQAEFPADREMALRSYRSGREHLMAR